MDIVDKSASGRAVRKQPEPLFVSVLYQLSVDLDVGREAAEVRALGLQAVRDGTGVIRCHRQAPFKPLAANLPAEYLQRVDKQCLFLLGQEMSAETCWASLSV